MLGSEYQFSRREDGIWRACESELGLEEIGLSARSAFYALRRSIIAHQYAAKVPVKAIASRLATTPENVRVLAHKMGLRHPLDNQSARRGFLVPEHLKADYEFLGKKGFTARERGEMLGILPRQEAA